MSKFEGRKQGGQAVANSQNSPDDCETDQPHIYIYMYKWGRNNAYHAYLGRGLRQQNHHPVLILYAWIYDNVYKDCVTEAYPEKENKQAVSSGDKYEMNLWERDIHTEEADREKEGLGSSLEIGTAHVPYLIRFCFGVTSLSWIASVKQLLVLS